MSLVVGNKNSCQTHQIFSIPSPDGGTYPQTSTPSSIEAGIDVAHPPSAASAPRHRLRPRSAIPLPLQLSAAVRAAPSAPAPAARSSFFLLRPSGQRSLGERGP